MYERLLQPRHSYTKYRKRVGWVEGDVGHLPLTNGKTALVDAKHLEQVSSWAWCDNGCGYAMNGSKPRIYLHHFILWLNGVERGTKQVDHINMNTLDNRVANLRVVTRSDNQNNRKVTGTSGYRGVSFSKDKKKWMAYIVRNQRQKFLGYFDDKTEAALAYDRAAIAHGGVYRLNILEGEV